MLAVAGGKGGCGKTTTTLGLAAAYARQRRRPLAVDGDSEMPNLHALADVPAAPGVEAYADGARPRRAVHDSGAFPGVSVLPAAPGDPVTEVLDDLAELERPVLLDCPAGASRAAAAPLRAADRVLVVTTTTPECLEDAVKTVEMARAVGTRVAGAVVTRAADPPPAVERVLGVPVLGTVPEVAATGAAVLRAADVRATYGRLAAELGANV